MVAELDPDHAHLFFPDFLLLLSLSHPFFRSSAPSSGLTSTCLSARLSTSFHCTPFSETHHLVPKNINVCFSFWFLVLLPHSARTDRSFAEPALPFLLFLFLSSPHLRRDNRLPCNSIHLNECNALPHPLLAPPALPTPLAFFLGLPRCPFALPGSHSPFSRFFLFPSLNHG